MTLSGLCRKAKIYCLNTYHKPTLKLEKLRIEENGGTVSNGRVNGILAVSRSLGDFNFKDLSKPPKTFSFQQYLKLMNKRETMLKTISAFSMRWYMG